MPNLRLRIIFLVLAVCCTGAAGAAAEPVGRELLGRNDLTGKPGTEVIVTRLTLAPGAKVARHTHPGDEFLYVVRGGIVQAPGKPPQQFKDGQVAHFPRGLVHGGFEVKGTEAMVVITTHVVDKGKPMTVPAPE